MSGLVALARREPARVLGLVTAVLALAAAFGLGLSDEQAAAVVAVVGAVLALLGGEAVRARVVPTVKVDQELGPPPGPPPGPALGADPGGERGGGA